MVRVAPFFWLTVYIGHGRLCICLSISHRIPTLLHGPGCNLGEWYGVASSCALLCAFAIGARVSLLWQHTRKLIALYIANAYSAEREMPATACTRSMAGIVIAAGLFVNVMQ